MIETRVEDVVTTVPTVAPDATVREAARRLRDAKTPALLVTPRDAGADADAVVGVVTPSSFVGVVADADFEGTGLPVASIADPPAAVLAPETPVRDAAARMCHESACHAPVVVGGTVRGLVTPETLAPYVPRTRLPVDGLGDGRSGDRDPGTGGGSGSGTDGDDADAGLAVVGPAGVGDD